ncbi:MAG: hypothetical protein HQM14_16750 [SAR324 cluster bacterium]|nr:hypothetical protein [SAR324 cluster bacterium]
MITGAILMAFVILSSSIINHGVDQLQKRKKMADVMNHLDAWTAEIKGVGFFSDALTHGSHQKEIHNSSQVVYLLSWTVKDLAPGFKGIDFQVKDPVGSKVLHEWKTGILLDRSID